MIKAVIFDLDGLMVDSEPVHYKAYAQVFQQEGKELPEQEYAKNYVGISDGDTARDMVSRYHLKISPQELLERKDAVFTQLLPGNVVPQKGLYELMEQLRAHGYKTAVASGALLSAIEQIIKALKLENSFDILCSAEAVAHGKPAPDLFLFAAKKLNVPPAECLVLEDAPPGVQAARAAGMKCFAIPSRETKGRDFSSADKVLANLGDVFEELRKL